MNEEKWYWEDTAMLLLVPAIIVYFFNVGMWGAQLSGQPFLPWYVSVLITLFTVVLPTMLFCKYAQQNERGDKYLYDVKT